MIIFQNPDNYNLSDSMVTVGVFDGVHRGHLSVLESLKTIAKQKFLKSLLVTFSEHPKHLLQSNEDFKLLTTNEEKLNLIRKTGIDALVYIPFNRDISNLNYSDFIKNILIKKFKAKTVLMGYDNHFGKDGDGSFINVSVQSSDLGIEVIQLNELNSDNHISSSKIRKTLLKGDIKTATDLLGYNYGFDSIVVEGNKLGRKMGFPTANLLISCPQKIMPNFGVYAVKVFFDNQYYNGILNYGLKPTVNNDFTKQPLAETHIFNFSNDLYGKLLRVEFVDKIRDEKKFTSIDELKSQIVIDIKEAEKILV